MSDQPEPKPMGWLKLSLLGVLVHAALAAGAAVRVLVAVPVVEKKFRDLNLALPALTATVLKVVGVGAGGGPSLWVVAGLAVFDFAMLAGLALWERPVWKWWFWGVVVVLLLGMAIDELALLLPEIKLREALSK